MDSHAPWNLRDAPAIDGASSNSGWLWARIRDPSAAIRAALEAQGLHFQPAHALPCALARATENMIDLVPCLSRIAEVSIATVHVLAAEPGFDVSHSEPRWRTTIFVSMPDRIDAVGALRFAEGVIHEAMHLHLTNAEERSPLVSDFDGRMPSPWRAETRSFQGVLHALFVFTCLAEFFRRLRPHDLEPDCRSHTAIRITEIQREVARLDISRLSAGLTPRGIALAMRWHTMALAAVPDAVGTL